MPSPSPLLLIYLGHLYHWEAVESVYEVLTHKGWDVEVYLEGWPERAFWFFKRDRRDRGLQILKNQGVQTTLQFHGPYDWILCTDVPSRAEIFRHTSRIAVVNHGTGIKTVLYRLLRRYSGPPLTFFVEGPHRARRLKEEHLSPPHRIHVTGYPKLDFYHQGRYEGTQILQKWGLDPTRPTILYAPTYKPSSIEQIAASLMEATAAYNLIVKLHPYSYSGWYAPHKHHRLMERWVASHPHAILLPVEEFRIMPYVAAADIVISEASSTLFEFLAAGKHGIIVDLTHEKLRHHDGEPLLEIDPRELLSQSFVHIRNPEELSAAIHQALHPTEAMRSALLQDQKTYFDPNDGHAAERIVAHLEEALA